MAKLSDVLGRTDVPFLTSTQKKALLAEGTSFSILRVTPNPTGKFGPEYRLTVKVAGFEDLAILSMKANPARDHEFEAMGKFLADGVETVGPVKLITATSKAGNEFVTITDADPEPFDSPDLGEGSTTEEDEEAF